MYSNKESDIQESQNVVNAVENTLTGLQSIYNYWDFEYDPATKIKELIILDGEAKEYHCWVSKLSDDEIVRELKNAHNKYVTFLAEWQKRHNERLVNLLKQ